MGRPLIIVESPAKAETIKKYLHGEFEVVASKGHVKDLPERSMGVDIAHGFRPKFVVVPSRRKALEALKKAAREADRVLLAPDPDREGEAIAWHIAEELRPINPEIARVLFHEITPAGVKAGVADPRPLDERMVESQLARRILDRLVGYQVSPILWRKVQRGLSAGRVQSPALRLIVEREREIEAFVPREYWVITAFLKGDGDARAFRATLRTLRGRKAEVRSGADAHALMDRLRGEEFRVSSVERKERRRPPSPPFITSTLQQEASRLLKFSPSRTMRLAQTLYEGVDLGEEGRAGLITYMRTDSVRVSDEAVSSAREEIARRFGPDYVPARPASYRSKKGAQDAHEAVRPTSVARRPEEVRPFLKPDEFRLYQLIYQRFLASQMVPAVYDQTTVDVRAADAEFRATGLVLRHDGYLAAWRAGKRGAVPEAGDGNGPDGGNGRAGEGGWAQTEALAIPDDLREGQVLSLEDLRGEQKFTEPPPRYSEATLIRELEERGIGRPSTYATIVTTIQDKGYCEKQNGRLRPTELGRVVTDLLVAHFRDVVDYDFTARMEASLDEVSEGRLERVALLADFWKAFEATLRRAEAEMRSVRAMAEPSGVRCDWCGREMLIRHGKNGSFLGCSGYPECRRTLEFARDENGHVRSREAEEAGTCPKCGSPLQIRTGRYGRFLACTSYPKCNYTGPYCLKARCPAPGCDGFLVEKRSRKGRPFYSCSRFPACRFSTSNEPVEEACPSCGAPTLFVQPMRGGRILICRREGCSFRRRERSRGGEGETMSPGEA